MVQYEIGRRNSYALISDSTVHTSVGVMASLFPILNNYITSNKKRITIISDSPSSQYRNKNIVYAVHEFVADNKITLKWINLESGRGKLRLAAPKIPFYTKLYAVDRFAVKDKQILGNQALGIKIGRPGSVTPVVGGI